VLPLSVDTVSNVRKCMGMLAHTWENAVAGRLAELVQLILIDNGVCSSSVLGPSDFAVVFAGDV
jgi:hypothetical protein